MMGHAVNGWHWGLGFGHPVFGILFWLVVIVLVLAMIKFVSRK